MILLTQYLKLEISTNYTEKPNEILHCLLQQDMINKADYASHSFRISVATTAAAAGIPCSLANKDLG